MSAALLARQAKQRAPSLGSKGSSKSRSRSNSGHFTPCTATASLLLYAQGSTVLCLHHDTLALDRRFTKHAEDVTLISVDNVSERGAGRLVVSYDVSQTAIIWDLFSGNQMSHFASVEPMRVASWMRNGNVAFGNQKGEVIIFEPSTSQHISIKTIYDPITALAPLADCKTYAIGYYNGSILLASLEPTFTILHTLATSRAPSPIANLAWHASSSKQKSDMLAVQTSDGDLRVWSVGKPPGADQPRVIRILKRSDANIPGPNWMGWSKNGRILQFYEKETWAWDVRTKHVTYEQIPTIEDVRGIANYGPTAALFTLGPNYSVQQYEIENPQVVANIQHFPLHGKADDSISIPSISASESEEEVPSPAPISEQFPVNYLHAGESIERTSSAQSDGRSNSMSSRTSSLRGTYGGRISPVTNTQTQRSGTTFSLGTYSQMTRESHNSSLGYPSTFHSPVSGRSYRRGSRLKQEVLRSPDEKKPLTELLPWTRARLAEVAFKPVASSDPEKLTADGLRRQMLRVVFGWDGDIEELLRAELKHHPSGSQNAMLLSKWLGDDEDHLAQLMGSSNSSSNLDWMVLALSGLGGDDRSKKIGQAFANKMLGKGDIHTAVTILISLGSADEAVEVYLAKKYFMEAILLTSLLMPKDWERQSFLVRKWGEHVVQNSQQHLALRCFSCAGLDPNVQLSATPLQVLSYAEKAQNIVPIKSTRSGLSNMSQSVPTLDSASISQSIDKPSSPESNRIPPSLKLITSFGPPGGEKSFRFPGLKSDDRTPTLMPGVTPIAESALPGGSAGPGLAPWSAGYGMNNNPTRVSTPGGFSRPRLPSIGETPTDLNPPEPPRPKAAQIANDSTNEKIGLRVQTPSSAPPTSALPVTSIPLGKGGEEPLTLLTSAVYDPSKEGKKRSTPVTAVPRSSGGSECGASNSPAVFEALKKDSYFSASNRNYRPDGLILNWPPVASSTGASTARSETPGSYTTAQAEASGSILSPSTTTDASHKSPGISTRKNRSIDRYINSLEEANYYSKHHRKIRHSKKSAASTDITTSSINDYALLEQEQYLEPEEIRGRQHTPRHIPPAKRSPSSPVPMAAHNPDGYGMPTTFGDPPTRERPGSKPRSRSQPRASRSKTPDVQASRHRSESRNGKKKKKSSSKTGSRHHSQDASQESRGRSRRPSDPGSLPVKSPSSPLPMTPLGSDVPKPDDALRYVFADQRRLKEQHIQRGSSREESHRMEGGLNAKLDQSPDRYEPRSRSGSRHAQSKKSRKSAATQRSFALGQEANHANSPVNSTKTFEEWPAGQDTIGIGLETTDRSTASSNPRFVSVQRQKELAQAELEARRQSLARRPSAPSIPRPGSVGHRKSASSNLAEHFQAKESQESSESSGSASRNIRSLALPGTPRAMRHPHYNSTYGGGKNAPFVPEVPDSLTTLTDAVYYNYNPIQRSMSAPLAEVALATLPSNVMPTHPAFQAHIPSSRSSSKTRAKDLNSEPKHSPLSPPPAVPEKSPDVQTGNEMPPLLPQLQHLANPMVPPPPPLKNAPNSVSGEPAGTINIRYEGEESIVEVSPASQSSPLPRTPVNEAGPLPATAVKMTSTAQSPYHHTRKDSRESSSILSVERDNIMGKFRNMTDRMRSSSRGRGQRSPPAVEHQDSPYESIPPMPLPMSGKEIEVQSTMI